MPISQRIANRIENHASDAAKLRSRVASLIEQGSPAGERTDALIRIADVLDVAISHYQSGEIEQGQAASDAAADMIENNYEARMVAP